MLRYRPLERAIDIAIGKTGTTEAIDRLGRLFDKAFDDVLTQKQRYRTWLFVYSGMLLLLLVYVARRLVRTYRIIGVVNKRLQGANETLELRVAERTAELEAQSAKLEQLAHHDGLTGLVNYGYFTRLLEHALVRAGRRGTTVVVMFFDLDGFKAVNDTFGHGTGDLVLQAVARRVQGKLRQEDVLARLGGDEFVILLEEVVTREGAMRVAQLTLDADPRHHRSGRPSGLHFGQHRHQQRARPRRAPSAAPRRCWPRPTRPCTAPSRPARPASASARRREWPALRRCRCRTRTSAESGG